MKVIQTPASKNLSPLNTFHTIQNPVLTGFTKDENEDVWNNHVDLGFYRLYDYS